MIELPVFYQRKQLVLCFVWDYCFIGLFGSNQAIYCFYFAHMFIVLLTQLDFDELLILLDIKRTNKSARGQTSGWTNRQVLFMNLSY